jgi:hypothetical protein
MKGFFFLSFILLLSSCSHDFLERDYSGGRHIASFYGDVHIGEVDFRKSIVRQFPPEVDGKYIRLFFFIQLKDEQGDYIDCNEKEFSVLGEKKAKVDFKIKRVMRGRYYVILEKEIMDKKKQLFFYLKDRPLTSERVLMKVADRKHSTLRILKKNKNRVKMLLTLNDKKNQPVELIYSPDVILDGNSNLIMKKVKLLSKGKWEITIAYPGENFIAYVSIRSLGFSFKDLLRFQHVEK